MKVRCLANKSEFLPKNYLDAVRGYTKELEFNLTLGREYVVYAIKSAREQVWYYICDDRYTYYPIPNPAPLFEIVDNRPSQYWRFKANDDSISHPIFKPETFSESFLRIIVGKRNSQGWLLELKENGSLEIAFAEWLDDRYFYDKLTDQEEKEVLIFERMKELIDAEANFSVPLPKKSSTEIIKYI
ncbi:MAG: hypothetical protein SAL07_00350 [Oscillatoria sp. PMC 1051.18]|nr:hypothetical protein [Oscillatoria sp. PMC 1050.18]MEC5028336.1 hypothetical protein [Oscillatoria sp. PMC 1051.18]NET87072.1 hypothetical protein [Kamptonema sp. SIO1D9]